MSIASAITNLQGKIANAYTAIENKGGTLPATQDAQNLSAAIADIPQGEVDKRKYGATIDDVYYNPSEGVLQLNGGVEYANFTGISSVSPMPYSFKNCTNLKSVSFPELLVVPDDCFVETFENCTNLSSISFTGLGLNALSHGSHAFQNAFKGCTNLKSVSFPALSSFKYQMFESAFEGCSLLSSASFEYLGATDARAVFRNAFKDSGVKSAVYPRFNYDGQNYSGLSVFDSAYENSRVEEVSFPALTQVNDSVFRRAFIYCTALSSISFPEVLTVGTGGFLSAFGGCTSLSTVSFPKLSSVSSGNNIGSFTRAFSGCTSLTSITFPKLALMNGPASFGAIVYGTGVTSLSFPELTAITNSGSSTSNGAFFNNTSLTRIDLPKLTVMTSNASTTGVTSRYTFSGCTNLVEIHFGAENQSIIESGTYYSTKWGAPNANCQIYFDL